MLGLFWSVEIDPKATGKLTLLTAALLLLQMQQGGMQKNVSLLDFGETMGKPFECPDEHIFPHFLNPVVLQQYNYVFVHVMMTYLQIGKVQRSVKK